MTTEKSQRPKVHVQEHRVLVQSKKLAALVNKSNAVMPETRKQTLLSDVEHTLNAAKALIDARLVEIMQQYPEGRKQSLFKLRYGSVEQMYNMDLKAAMQLLNIDAKHLNLRLIENQTYHGNKI